MSSRRSCALIAIATLLEGCVASTSVGGPYTDPPAAQAPSANIAAAFPSSAHVAPPSPLVPDVVATRTENLPPTGDGRESPVRESASTSDGLPSVASDAHPSPTQPEVAQSRADEEGIATQTPSSAYVEVTKVVDGDTFDVVIDGRTERVRVIGIDTPETVDPRKTVECFGQEAALAARTRLSGKRVRLQPDATQGDRDKYGRILRYAYLEDGLFFNKWMIQQGYAHEYTYGTPYEFQQAFRDAERASREARRGLWAEDACYTSVAESATASRVQASAIPGQAQGTVAGSSGHTWYASSHQSAKYYYCDTDEGWRALSATYLLSFPSEEALLARFPTYSRHAPCG